MKESIEKQILGNIKEKEPGRLFFPEDFLYAGNAKAISKALERLTLKKELIRVATGIYQKPKYSQLLENYISPSTEEIANAIARRDKARIVPTGVYALNRLGLSTQVPLNAVYLTDGAARSVKIDKRGILFKRAAPKNLAAVGPVSSLVIQALKTIGNGKVVPQEEARIMELLAREKKVNLEHDIALAPEWIRKIMRKAHS